MEFTAKVIADFLNGDIEGNPDEAVTNVSKIEEGTKGTLAFLANPKYEKYLYDTEASIVLINRDLRLQKEVNTTLIRVDNAYQAFAALLDMYEKSRPQKSGHADNAAIDPTAVIGENAYIDSYVVVGKNAAIGNNVKLYPQVYIGDNAVIGDNVILYPGVKIYDECKVGNNCVLHAGTVVGSDGFGFANQEDGSYQKIPQMGNVIIEDDVEIGSNVSIDCATMGSTIIRRGVKIDNLVQIAHNVEIGEHTVIVAQAGIAGSSKIGKNCMIGGQVGIVGHIQIADGVKIAAQAGVSSSIKKEGEILLGSPATNIGLQRRAMAVYKNLPDLRQKILDLEKEIEQLKSK
ncbi:MAG: UDP-3-O-(3-hydroxymyristoyl)glucosamine N-acyltransferase [Bacteroidetes bacterium]|jgi:UDP-3-O-[3-hydroxymyristoyl] glucosamine N-acyltransferase|nr:UDP-3-O-(3-hydroxymyristoyl)glucosamine N-acyltransferase [Bacteroidota bacterium]